MNRPQITPIEKIHEDAPTIKTMYFHHTSPVKPGQFYMIWIPGTDEIPMSVSKITPKTKAITFRTVGEATEVLASLQQGDKIGIRGPYGNGFTITGSHLLVVGGGTGIATLAPVVDAATQHNKTVTVVLGAKTQSELFFEQRMKTTGATVHIATDDGSKGTKGLATDIATALLSSQSFDQMLTCGPELMMKTLISHSKHIPFQASLERYMKCAVGMCGQCCIGEGLRVCIEGPVFDAQILKTIPEFGVYRRDASGTKVPF